MVKRSAGDPFSRRSAVDKNFIRFGRSGDYFHEVPDRTRQKNVMSFARVSRATKDNFMRFGRPDADLQELYLAPTADSSSANRRGENFMRFGRAKDNFMRFGRKDNFMRFGRKDNFMRFGRTFMRFGRGKDNFMRFGRGDNFMRFGRGKDNFMRFGRKDNFMRFGRDPVDTLDEENSTKDGDSIEKKSTVKGSFVRFGKSPKNDDGFIRFGRGEPEDPEDQKIDDDGPEVEIGDLDLQADKPKNGPIIRIKREAPPTSLWEVEANSLDRPSRDSEVMEEIPPLTGQSENESKDGQKRFIHPDFILDMEPFSFENDLGSAELDPSSELLLNEGKRSSGGSGFIRFG